MRAPRGFKHKLGKSCQLSHLWALAPSFLGEMLLDFRRGTGDESLHYHLKNEAISQGLCCKVPLPELAVSKEERREACGAPRG